MSSREFIIIYLSSESSSIYDSSVEAEIYSTSATLRSFYTKPPSSNCANVIILSVWSWYDVAYRIYETAGPVMSASEYGCGVYANTLKNVFK